MELFYTNSSRLLFLYKSFIVDVRLGSKYLLEIFLFRLLSQTFQITISSVLFINPAFNIMFRSSRTEEFCKKGVLWNFAKFTGKNTCAKVFFNKVAGPRPETLAHVFSCEFCEISKNTLFYKAPPVAASELLKQFLKNLHHRCLAMSKICLWSYNIALYKKLSITIVLHYDAVTWGTTM